MVDVDTFLTTLYVMVDDFCKTSLPPRPSWPAAALSRSETVTLAFGQWQGFGSERGFYRYASATVSCLPPTAYARAVQPAGAPALRGPGGLFSVSWGRLLAAQHCLYEALDSSGIPTRDAKAEAPLVAGLSRYRLEQPVRVVR